MNANLAKTKDGFVKNRKANQQKSEYMKIYEYIWHSHTKKIIRGENEETITKYDLLQSTWDR